MSAPTQAGSGRSVAAPVLAAPVLAAPWNAEAEEAVLGSLLLDNDEMAKVRAILGGPDAFYGDKHRTVYRAMESVLGRGTPADTVTLAEELKSTGRLEDVGGAMFVAGLADNVPTSLYATHYAKIVAKHHHRREKIVAAGKVLMLADNADLEPDELHARAVEAVTAAKPGSSRGSAPHITEPLDEVWADIERGERMEVPEGSVRSGLLDVDAIVNPLEPGTVSVLAARPSQGKSALMMQYAFQAAVDGTGALVLSLEMRRKALLKRALCMAGRVDMARMKSGDLSDRDKERLHNAAARLKALPLFVEDHPEATVESLSATVREHSERVHPLGFVAVDYLQLMEGLNKGKNFNRQEEVAGISRGLLRLARSLDVPFLVLSQLSRNCEARPDKRPILSDLRESGQIEQDANLVLALYRDDYYHKDSPKAGIAEAIILKQREGALGTAEVQWHGAHTRFENLARGL